MVYLYEKTSGQLFGEISEDQLQFLIDQLEEEFIEDQDYAITRMTLDYFVTQNGDPQLISLLDQALGDRDEIVILWSRQKR